MDVTPTIESHFDLNALEMPFNVSTWFHQEAIGIDTIDSTSEEFAGKLDIRSLSIQLQPIQPKVIGFTFPESPNWVLGAKTDSASPAVTKKPEAPKLDADTTATVNDDAEEGIARNQNHD